MGAHSPSPFTLAFAFVRTMGLGDSAAAPLAPAVDGYGAAAEMAGVDARWLLTTQH